MKLFDVLKAGAGLPVEDSFAALWGQQMAGTSFVAEMQGAPPLQIVSAGKPLTAYRIYGNSVQDGTPTPDNPIEVQSVGDKTKNLFDKNDATISGYIIVDGSIKQGGSGWLTTENFIKCSGSISLQAKNGLGSSAYISCYDSNKVFLGSVKQSSSNDSISTIQLIEGTEYIKTCCRENNLDSYQLELGSEATAYEPYGYKIPVVTSGENHEPITTNIYLDEPLRKIGSYADVIDFERGVVERKIGKVVLDGSDDEQWYYYAQPGVSQKYIAAGIVGGSPVISDKLRSISNQQRPYQYDSIYSASNPPSISINSEIPNSSDEWRNWLSENHITAYYVLAESTTEPISIPSIPTFDGTTVIRVDTKIQPPNMYVKYNGKR